MTPQPNPPYPPMLHPVEIRQFVGAAAFERGIDYFDDDRVGGIEWNPESRQVAAYVEGAPPTPYRTLVTFTRGTNPQPGISACSCPMRSRCKHTAALLLAASHAAMRAAERASAAPVKQLPPWRRKLDAMLGGDEATDAPGPLGVQFEVVDVGGRRRKKQRRLSLRPVTLNDKGRWIYGNLRWGGFGPSPYGNHHYSYQQQQTSFSDAQKRWMEDFVVLHAGAQGQNAIYLEDFASPVLWQLLAGAHDAGIVLRGATAAARLTIHAPVAVGLDLVDANGKLRVAPAIHFNGHGDAAAPLSGDGLELGIIGQSGHGVWWQDQPDVPARERPVHLAPSVGEVPGVVVQLLEDRKPLEIPRNGRAAFLSDYVPELGRLTTLGSSDGSIEVPEPVPPHLWLTAGHFRRRGPRNKPDVTGLRLAWTWDYGTEGARNLPLVDDGQGRRDRQFETSVLHRVTGVLDDFPGAWRSAFPQPLLGIRGSIEPLELEGVDAARFSAEAMPLLEGLDGVSVQVQGEEVEYVELTDSPEISVSASESGTSDWFDLGVQVHLGGAEIPFDQLFVALAQGEDYLLLDDGAYLSLDKPEYRQLRRLIEEARTLQDRESKGLRISRHQASLWDELVELSANAEQAESWRLSVGGLLELETIEPTAPPAALQAELRPYQQQGFSWLAFLHDHGLGGVLADDMGLGKTVQTIALMLHAHDRARSAGERAKPFLVVAPTSVVPNWATEAARFAPSLRTAVVGETLKRTGMELGAVLEGTDVVVVSYALFRLENADYARHDWSGLILDEAQFVKNPATKAAAQAREFPASFKLAITGTPMENNLSELWSMFAITSPGLFASAKKFDEVYRKPIEKDGDKERLAQLRRRIRPLIMRRTKELVATELPPKQEQVLELELSPKHRTIYQRHLQRERQKVLGMIDEMDKNRFQIFRSLTMLRQLSLDASLVDERYAGVPSSKLDALLEQLDDLVAEGHSALVFSQFTSFLGKAAQRLGEAGIPYAYLDGSTKSRGKVIEKFTGGSVPVFLISLKAGGFGLNLTQADYCFMLDPWWNPASENQAVDRAHRIGQTRNLMVYRLVAKDTIEEKVMALKEKKAKLFSAVMDEDAAFGSAIDAEDVRSLFRD
ncbi:SNF2-related protein [Arthrobacter sp. KK5.5]|uniref:SNF2-related protein n=1 Tax=Arthrobacter sp. KK5.5 TaxID=3373084 RepID=UPI003EE81F74